MRYVLLVRFLDGAWHVAKEFETLDEAKALQNYYMDRIHIVHTRVFDTDAGL